MPAATCWPQGRWCCLRGRVCGRSWCTAPCSRSPCPGGGHSCMGTWASLAADSGTGCLPAPLGALACACMVGRNTCDLTHAWPLVHMSRTRRPSFSWSSNAGAVADTAAAVATTAGAASPSASHPASSLDLSALDTLLPVGPHQYRSARLDRWVWVGPHVCPWPHDAPWAGDPPPTRGLSVGCPWLWHGCVHQGWDM